MGRVYVHFSKAVQGQYDIERMPWNIRRALDQVNEYCSHYFLQVASFMCRGVMVPEKGGCVADERKTGKFGADSKMHPGFSKTILESVFSKSYCRDEFRECREVHANLVMGYAPKRRNNPFLTNPLYQLPS